MPVRKRSPNSANAPWLPEDPTSFQTVRTRNADGTSTVYQIHESMNGSGGMSGLPPGVLGGGGMPSNGGYGAPYGQQQHQHQPNVVYVQQQTDNNYTSDNESNDNDNDSDSDSDDEQPLSPTTSTALIQQSFSNSKSKRCCRPRSTTSPICIILGILIAISFIVGYIFMIDAIVTHNRTKAHSNNGEPVALKGLQSSSKRNGNLRHPPSTMNNDNQQPSTNLQHTRDEMKQNQKYENSIGQELQLTEAYMKPKYYKIQPVVSEITVDKIPAMAAAAATDKKAAAEPRSSINSTGDQQAPQQEQVTGAAASSSTVEARDGPIMRRNTKKMSTKTKQKGKSDSPLRK